MIRKNLCNNFGKKMERQGENSDMYVELMDTVINYFNECGPET